MDEPHQYPKRKNFLPGFRPTIVILSLLIVLFLTASIILFLNSQTAKPESKNYTDDNIPLTKNTTCKNKKIYNSLEDAQKDKDACLIDLSGKKLANINEILKSLPPQIEKLDLSNNNFIEIPKELRNHPTLSYLNLSNNKIDQIDKSISALGSVKTLNLSHNRIDRFPDDFILPPQITTLDLSYNSIHSLPLNISSPSLKTLILTGNNLRIPDPNKHNPIKYPGIKIIF